MHVWHVEFLLFMTFTRERNHSQNEIWHKVNPDLFWFQIWNLNTDCSSRRQSDVSSAFCDHLTTSYSRYYETTFFCEKFSNSVVYDESKDLLIYLKRHLHNNFKCCICISLYNRDATESLLFWRFTRKILSLATFTIRHTYALRPNIIERVLFFWEYM